MKQRVYFNEFNIPTKSSIYLPYSSGLLRAYAETKDIIRDNYEFCDFLFIRDEIENILKRYKNPSVAAFSCSMWNFELSLAIAKAVKKEFSNCLIIFGGPNVPLHADEFFNQYPFIDIGIHAEGERLFTKILEQNIIDKKQLPIRQSLHEEKTARDLDIFPSPYSGGIFDELIDQHQDIEFKAIVETNRACPFSCTFCYWGQGSLARKLAYHSLEYTKKEAEWIAEKNIKYVFCADANFGMFKRDIDIAKIFANVKEKHSYPEKFRVCYGKNTVESIFETAFILSKADLAKTVTLAIQSNNEETLKNIKRNNIKMDAFINLQKRYTDANIPTYTEIILGLPGETKQSFIDGLDTIISSIINNQVFIYHCQVLANTAMSAPEYLEKYGMKTTRVPMAEVHGNVRITGQIPEYEHIVISTNSMPVEDWIECAVISWITQLCHGLKICFDTTEWLVTNYPIKRMDVYHNFAKSNNKYIQNFWNIARNITEGSIRCQENSMFGEIYWEPEELTFLEICYNESNFYQDFYYSVIDLLDNKNINYNNFIIHDMIMKQKNILPDINDFDSPENFATEVMLYGRKSNKLTKDITNKENMPIVLAFS